LPSLLRLAVNILAINFSSAFVDNQYFEVLIVPQAVIAKILRHRFAVIDRIGIGVELNADAVSHRDAVSHIEKEFSHGRGPVTRISANLVRALRNHSPAMNLVRGSVYSAGFDGALRLQPGLRHQTLDDMPLNSFADGAAKRSQILTRTAWLDRRKLHGRTASRALRTLALSFEHGRCLSSVFRVLRQAIRPPST
jgi:hypothetical protein